ncbi:hypothetical protein PanWU01x14_176920, partial [Parasponia andersonii]
MGRPTLALRRLATPGSGLAHYMNFGGPSQPVLQAIILWPQSTNSRRDGLAPLALLDT